MNNSNTEHRRRGKVFKQQAKNCTLWPIQSLEQSGPYYKFRINNTDFEGSKSDVARFYCLMNGVKLYTLPDDDNPLHFSLYAIFKEQPDSLVYIVTLDGIIDLETAYSLFFEDYIQRGKAEHE